MENTKIWKDTEKILEEVFPELINKIADLYPPTAEFHNFYQGLMEYLHAISIVFVTERKRSSDDFLLQAKTYFPLAIQEKVTEPLKKMASKLEKYKSSLKPQDIEEYSIAEKKEKREKESSYIS